MRRHNLEKYVQFELFSIIAKVSNLKDIQKNTIKIDIQPTE